MDSSLAPAAALSLTTPTPQPVCQEDAAQPDIITNSSKALPPQADGMLRMVVLSDTHGSHDGLQQRLPTGDVLVHLGDICDRGELDHLKSFAAFLRGQPHACKLVIEGNHDRDLIEPDRFDLARVLGDAARVLHDETVEVGGVRFHGARWASCEADTYGPALCAADVPPPDVLLTHLPAAVDTGLPGHRYGSDTLLRLVETQRIPLHLFGHVHAGRGVGTRGTSTFVNCATLRGQPVVIDVDAARQDAGPRADGLVPEAPIDVQYVVFILH